MAGGADAVKSVDPTDAKRRALLAESMLSEELDAQVQVLRELSASGGDSLIAQALIAWRGGSVYLFETNGTRTPVRRAAHHREMVADRADPVDFAP